MLKDKFQRGRSVQPVCLVIGAGAGIGGNVAKRFAKEGFHACLCRRSDEAGLARLVEEIKDEGGNASGYILNAVEEGLGDHQSSLKAAAAGSAHKETIDAAYVACERN